MAGTPLLDVLNGRQPSRRPVWFMRQAGRYLPEYREVRAKAGSFVDLCYNPELAAEVTLQPLRRFDLDAAILFADILVVPHAMGSELRFAEGEGPILSKVTDHSGVRALKSLAASPRVAAVCETVRQVRSELKAETALIGFCGGPWTVASYMLEGGSSERVNARLAAYDRVSWFEELIDRLVLESADYLSAQIEAGAQAVQIFDSWAGEIVGDARRRVVVEPLAKLSELVRSRHPKTPIIVFARGVGRDHALVAEACQAQAVGVETEDDLGALLPRLPRTCAVQGNLDPVMLLAEEAPLVAEVERIAKSVPMARHIFNLGHGIRQQTKPERVATALAALRGADRTL